MSSTALPVIIILGMPIYEYRCPDGHRFEVFQSMADDPVTECEVCGKPVERVFHPIAVHFKGSGFYTTDYARKGASKGSGEDGSKGSGVNNGDSKSSESKSGDLKSSDSKSEKPKTSSSSD
jgi:putative FmdB family regulatory protein